MTLYKVLRIDDEDFGCEGRPEGYEPQCLVLLEDEKGEQTTVRIADALLTESGINEGSRICRKENGQYRLFCGE